MARLGSFIPLEDLAAAARFLGRLPSFLRHPVSLEEARVILRRRLEQREVDFLAFVRRAIYEQAGSPYRELLTLVGCEYGDLERLVNHEGVEGALRALFRRGVYLTVEELKGRRPVVRGNVTITVAPPRLRNPLSVPRIPAWSSGSRGYGTPAPIDFAFVRDRAVNLSLPPKVSSFAAPISRLGVKRRQRRASRRSSGWARRPCQIMAASNVPLSAGGAWLRRPLTTSTCSTISTR